MSKTLKLSKDTACNPFCLHICVFEYIERCIELLVVTGIVLNYRSPYKPFFMKTVQLLLLATLTTLLFSQQANAKVWRVNSNSNYNGSSLWGDNFGGTSANPVFKQLSDANSSNLISATAGDTIHFEGSSIDYTGVTITKKLVIIGPGYFLNENTNVSNDLLSARISDVTFSSGSSGSQLIGVHVFGGFGITINVSTITIKRCRIDRSISLTNGIADILVLQNFFSNSINPSETSSAILGSGFGFPTGFIFDNNICKKTFLLVSGTNVRTAQEVNNNTFDCPSISGSPSIQLNTGSFKNNILKTPTATVNINNNTNNNVSFCVSSSSTGQFGTANSNIVVTNISSIFASSGSTDGLYQLKSGSVASGDGSDGTDRGAFGNTVPSRYTLSGLAAIPVIYQLTTSGVATPASGLSVTIKARTIK